MLKEIGWLHLCLFPSGFSLRGPWINDEEPGQQSMCLGFPLLTLIVPICWLLEEISRNSGGSSGTMGHWRCVMSCQVLGKDTLWENNVLPSGRIPRLPKWGRVLMSPEDKPFIFPIVSPGTYFLLFIPAFVNQWVMSLASESKQLPSCRSFQNEPRQRFGR